MIQNCGMRVTVLMESTKGVFGTSDDALAGVGGRAGMKKLGAAATVAWVLSSASPLQGREMSTHDNG